MKCPSCGESMVDTSISVTCPGERWTCSTCALQGPADVLEALAALKSPAVVLAEAERLLREARISELKLHPPEPRAPDALVVTAHVRTGPGVLTFETWGSKTLADLLRKETP